MGFRILHKRLVWNSGPIDKYIFKYIWNVIYDKYFNPTTPYILIQNQSFKVIHWMNSEELRNEDWTYNNEPIDNQTLYNVLVVLNKIKEYRRWKPRKFSIDTTPCADGYVRIDITTTMSPVFGSSYDKERVTITVNDMGISKILYKEYFKIRSETGHSKFYHYPYNQTEKLLTEYEIDDILKQTLERLK